MTEDEVTAEVERLTALGIEGAEACERPDRPGEWFVSIGGALKGLTASEFSDMATQALKEVRKDA